jgi:putative DNA primase/helicase
LKSCETLRTFVRFTPLLEKLIAELPGILRWAIEGCLAWQQGSLQEPKEVTDAVHAYQLEMDIVGQFLDDCCWLKPDRPEIRTQSSTLYQAFCRYAGDVMTQTALRGYTKRKTDGRYWWIGIGLNVPEDTRSITDDRF